MNGRVHKPRQNKGGLSRYYLSESMPLALCGACLMVVLQHSTKARRIHSKVVESHELPGMRALFCELERELPAGNLCHPSEDGNLGACAIIAPQPVLDTKVPLLTGRPELGP